MIKLRRLQFVYGLAFFVWASLSVSAQTLGEAPRPPADVSGLPGRGPHPRDVTGGLYVDTSSREQVREFYNAVYQASTGAAIGSSPVTDECFPGTNSPAFINATLLRVNWFRAMAGLPASVTFDVGEGTLDQAAALMMSAQGELQHAGDWTGWNCYSSQGTNAADNSNLALGFAGPDAVTAYVWDFGANNAEVGHRRYVLYPQTQVMGTGDMPAQGTNLPANALWVFDANYGGPRPATRTPFVAWPPAGYVPFQVVYPQWSFALSNVDLSTATVSMTSNGVPLAVTQQGVITGYGENTLVWYPTGLDTTSAQTVFPFSGTDTVYGITVSNLVTSAGPSVFSYNVTVIDPGTPGPDYAPVTISGPGQPVVGAGNVYSSTPASNPNTTGYQWLVAQAADGDLADDAQNGTTNFTLTPVPGYPFIIGPPAGSGNCFHLTHASGVPQLMQLNEQLFPASNTVVSFASYLGYSTPAERARVQVLVNGGTNWQDLFYEAGNNGSSDNSFTQHSFSLSNYAGNSVFLRFNYDLAFGSYYPETESVVGWCLENIVVTNALQLEGFTTNVTSTTNFTFTPESAGDYILQAQGVIFNAFPTQWGTVSEVTAVVGPPVIVLSAPSVAVGVVTINFTLTSGTAASFHLLQTDQPGSGWITNTSAILTTNGLGASYQFTTTNGAAMQFYRVQTP